MSYQANFTALVRAVHELRPDLDARKSCKMLDNCHRAMIRRCFDPANKDYKRYGGRGITVDPEWGEYPVAGRDRYVLWAVTHGWEPGLTVDREDNDGDYSPANCRVTNRTMQAWNTRQAVMRPVLMPCAQLRRLLHVGCKRLAKMSDEELSERLCELADAESAKEREARNRLSHGKCPCCGADAVAVYQDKGGHIVGCPDCLSTEDIYSAAVRDGAI